MRTYLYALQDSATDCIACATCCKNLSRQELDLLHAMLSDRAANSNAPTVRARIAEALDRYAGDTGIRLELQADAPDAFIKF